MASTMDCDCSKISNHGLNHGWFPLFIKFFGSKYIINWFEKIQNSNLIAIIFDVQANLPETSPFYLPKWLCWGASLKCLYILLGMYYFDLCVTKRARTPEWNSRWQLEGQMFSLFLSIFTKKRLIDFSFSARRVFNCCFLNGKKQTR